jgi:L-ribulose-5-phosphate 4-epimerase
MYTWGNVSAFDAAAGVFAIKPSGVPYDALRPEDMVVLDLDGGVVEGKLRPSSDMPTHLALYRRFSGGGIRGITHTHSPYAVAWAQAARSIPLLGTTHADHAAFAVPCTAFLTEDAVKRNYEEETGVLIADTFRDLGLSPVETPMVLVAGHGPFAWGESAEKAVYHACVLEEIAKMAALTLGINPAAKPLPAYITAKHYTRKHGANAYYGQGNCH